MKGFVPTPDQIVDLMIHKLFHERPPRPGDSVLDPGCGPGAFIEGIVRWCRNHKNPVPHIVGIESNPRHVLEARRRLGHLRSVKILQEDFLAPRNRGFDYVIGNPPYVPITKLSQAERDKYRKRFVTAVGRFDLYLLFFEQALKHLRPRGRLVFITPEKFLYVGTAQPLRRMLGQLRLEEICLVDEETFGGLVTYPTITTITNEPADKPTKVLLRDGSNTEVNLAGERSSWLPLILARTGETATFTLTDACLRISCGVATGADSIYVAKTADLQPRLRRFAYPTIAGREIALDRPLVTTHSMLVPYTRDGELLPEGKLGLLRAYLFRHRQQLLKRTCVARKPWYAFHENPPLPAVLRPKILCKDITAKPFFVVEESGKIVPRHSVYYIVPKDPSVVRRLAEYLNSSQTQAWLAAHCQRVASGFLRLQSHVLKQIPIPEDLLKDPYTGRFRPPKPHEMS